MEWTRVPPTQQISFNTSTLIRGKVTKGSKCKLKLNVTSIYHAKGQRAKANSTHLTLKVRKNYRKKSAEFSLKDPLFLDQIFGKIS